MSNWDTSQVTNMSSMFRNATNFNQDIGNWDTSKVTNTVNMFNSATSFNQNIGGWDTGSLVQASSMFVSAASFNGDISGWNTSKLEEMNGMFNGATAFNGDISGWDTSAVTTMNNMFKNAESFNQNIGGWDTSSVTSMEGMFRAAYFFDADISGWDTSSVTDMSHMFYSAHLFRQDLKNWDTSQVRDMDYMFRYAYYFNSDLSGWNVSYIASVPTEFDYYSNPEWIDDHKPVWGTSGNDALTITTLSPAKGAHGVDVGAVLSLTFDRDVEPGTGDIRLYSADDVLVQQFDVESDVTFSDATVTLNPTTDLADGNSYYVQIAAGAIVDASDASYVFAGISDTSTWAFTTQGEGEFSAEQVSLIETSLLVADTMAAQPLNAAAFALTQSASSGGQLDGSYPPPRNLYIGQLQVVSGRDGGGGFSLVDWFTYGIADSNLDADLSGDGLLAYATLGTELSKTQDQVRGLTYGIEVSEWTYEDELDVDRLGLSFGYYQGQALNGLMATGSATLTLLTNDFVNEEGATGDALSTRFMLSSEVRGKREYEDGSSLAPFANVFFASESVDAFDYSDGERVNSATVDVGSYSVGLEYESKAYTQGRYLIRGSLGQTFGAEEITLSDGAVYKPNEDITGTVTFGWDLPAQGDSRTSLELTFEGLGDSDSEVIRLDGNWDRAF